MLKTKQPDTNRGGKGKNKKKSLFDRCRPHPNTDKVLGGVDFTFHGNVKSSTILSYSKNNEAPIFCLLTSKFAKSSSPFRMLAEEVLHHPLIVEVIEDLFVSVAIFMDDDTHRETMKTLTGKLVSTDCLNTPVVLVLDSEGKKLNSGEFHEQSTPMSFVGSKVMESLLSFKRDELNPVPRYLKHVVREERTYEKKTDEKLFFAMTDSWIGEAEFAECHGIISCKAGWLRDEEIVMVVFDSKAISMSELVRFAIARSRTKIVYYVSDKERQIMIHQRKLSNQSNEVQICRLAGSIGGSIRVQPSYYYMSNTVFCKIPMTEYQRCRVNFALYTGDEEEAFALLSPRQNEMLRQFSKCDKKRPVDSFNIYEGWEIAMAPSNTGTRSRESSYDLTVHKLSTLALEK
mmetsp:Transcript_21050/g.27128  ORF Transcript_21050/g.27128 Transcript_21050/m.27128 type:complete len:402 (+) Transcript_21050:104-1309(+)|eukprot:CAMPEP_0116063298 /NCGR_PEP_ID=MMETSP0322-20121206/8330_1 /TAXON_ID=163516 /ORGANISM="Leptocylindrus danicus var. apora, Strain B651" /LENGTH=401 /DNA_ID=CAMNT_0003548887 /DNA_START=30 /DNA_END=1235 /DNA_ORIENTATION=-